MNIRFLCAHKSHALSEAAWRTRIGTGAAGVHKIKMDFVGAKRDSRNQSLFLFPILTELLS